MAEAGAYGSRMAAHLQLESAPVVTMETKRKAKLAVTRLRSDTGLARMSEPIPVEKAFAISLHLVESLGFQIWMGQGMVHDGRFAAGAVSIVDLQRELTIFAPYSFDCLQFYVPRAALDEIAHDHGTLPIETLAWPQGRIDPNFHHLGMSLLPALEHPEQISRLYLDQVMLALLFYSAQTYGGMDPKARIARGGLAPWQMRRATEMLRERLDGEISLSEVAAECRLSVSHFARSFKQAIGQTPHRWLLDRRVDAAKNLMLHSGMRLSEIALGCGFADQTSFNRTFKKIAGTSPGDWRRTCRQ